MLKMKKILILLAILTIASLAIFSCDNGEKTECDKNGHSWADATCTSPKTCTVCQATEGGTLSHVYTTYTSNNDATCTSDGTKTAKCDGCATATDTVTDTGSKKPHAYGEWTISKATTCESDGVEQRNCTICQAHETRPLATTGHSYNTEAWGYQGEDGHAHKCASCNGNDTVVPHTPGAAATETTAQVCTDCGYVIAPPLGHTHSFTLETANETTLKSNADCYNAAVYYKSCACGAVSTSADDTFEVGEPNEHDLSDLIVIENATCEEDGVGEYKCKHCDYFEDGYVPATGHNWLPATSNEPEKCSWCGETKEPSIESTLPGDMDPNGWTDN